MDHAPHPLIDGCQCVPVGFCQLDTRWNNLRKKKLNYLVGKSIGEFQSVTDVPGLEVMTVYIK